MRVCIFQINSKYVHSSLAAWYLYSGVKKYAPSADASVLEGTVNEPIGVLLDRALSAVPSINVRTPADTGGIP